MQNENIPYKCTVSDHIPVLFKPTYFFQLFTVGMFNFLQNSFNSVMINSKYHVEGPPQGHLECHIGYTYSQPIFIILYCFKGITVFYHISSKNGMHMSLEIY